MIDDYLDDEDELASPRVEARLLNDQERLAALPAHFGPHMMRYEIYVYGWMDLLSVGYEGGHWDMYRLSNGGFYMSPSWPAHFQVQVEGNGFRDTMSADATGVVVNVFALHQLASEFPTEANRRLYSAIREYGASHPEAIKIYRAID